MDDTAPSGPEVKVDEADASAYAQLHSIIVAGELPDGAWLQESPLAERIGVSDAPQEALDRLSAEGIVEIRRNKDAQRASFSPDEVTDLSDIRAGFEPPAARLAFPRLDNGDVDQLPAFSARMDEVVTTGRHSEINALGSAFTGSLLSSAATALRDSAASGYEANHGRAYFLKTQSRGLLHDGELVAAAEAKRC